jgi:F-box/TPR repeat protein Pof3
MADHALSHLRPEDAQRHTQLVELREKAVAAQAAVEKHRLSQVAQTSYLLGKLPVETLVEIFTILIDEDHTWAVKLSHVCGHWRQILINTPSAWQTLVLSRERPLRKAKLWKQRAQHRISCIRVVMSELDRAPVFAQLQDLSWDHLSSLCSSAKGFIELHRMLSNISLPHTFSGLAELTLLECTSPDVLSCCLFGPNWKLKTLRLDGCIYMMDEWWERIQQLRELHLVGLIDRFSLPVFTANPSLERLILSSNMVRVDFNPDNNATPTSMSNLKSIECRSVANPFSLLRAIAAPSITQFSISTAVMADETLLDIASSPSLVELHITTCGLSPSTLPSLLSSTPNLETLQVNVIHAVVNEMFRFLTPKTVDSLHALPCRALKHVDVTRCSDLTTSSAYAFVKTRAQYASESVESAEKCAVVVSLKLDGCPNIEPDMLPWFRSKVVQFSCVYGTKKDFTKNRR